MWSHCKQPCTGRKKERKMAVVAFPGGRVGWPTAQTLSFMRSKRSPVTAHTRVFPLGHSSCEPDGRLWADPAWEPKRGLWWWGGANAKQNLLFVGKYGLSLLRKFASSVTSQSDGGEQETMKTRLPFSFWSKGSLWTPHSTLISGTKPGDG